MNATTARTPSGALGRIAMILQAPLGEVMRARSRAGLPSVQGAVCKMVLVAIADHAGGEDLLCWAGMETLVRETGCERSTLSRAIRILESLAILRVERRHRVRGQARARRTTVYQVDYAALADLCAEPADHQDDPRTDPGPEAGTCVRLTQDQDRSCASLTPDHVSGSHMRMCQADTCSYKEEHLPGTAPGNNTPPSPPSGGDARDRADPDPDPLPQIPDACRWRSPHARPIRDIAEYRRTLEALPAGWSDERLHAAMRRYAAAVASGDLRSPMTIRGWLRSACYQAPEWDPGERRPAEVRAHQAAVRDAMAMPIDELEALAEMWRDRWAHRPEAEVRAILRVVLERRGEGALARLSDRSALRATSNLRLLRQWEEWQDAGQDVPAQTSRTETDDADRAEPGGGDDRLLAEDRGAADRSRVPQRREDPGLAIEAHDCRERARVSA